jgi:nitrate reductase delta subunit
LIAELLRPPGESTRQALASAFADVLSYPHDSPLAAAQTCEALAREQSAEAGRLLESFRTLASAATPGEQQEAYTWAFDLGPVPRAEPPFYPYVGHHLFEESHRRGAFIVELRKRFRAEGFDEETELADHLVVLLRFLATCRDETLAGELIDDALLPALARTRPLREPSAAGRATLRGAYLGVVTALELALRALRPAIADEQAVEAEREWSRDRDSLGIDRGWCPT